VRNGFTIPVGIEVIMSLVLEYSHGEIKPSE
jgi:hypothetical protein